MANPTSTRLAPDVAQARKLAMEARARRAKAPNTPPGEKSPIEQKNLMREVRRTYKEKGLPVPHLLWIPKAEKLKSYGYLGYSPVLEDVDSGDTFEIQGDIMVECSEKQYQDILAANSKKSQRIPQGAMKKAMDEGKSVGGQVNVTTAKGSPDGAIVGPEVDLLGESG